MSHRRRIGSITGIGMLLALGAAVLTPPSFAGQPPPGCVAWMDSDIMVFAEGDPIREIVGFIDSSATCTDVDGDLLPELTGSVFVEFGPYAVPGCNTPDAIVEIAFNGEELREGAGQGGGEATYIPFIATQAFPGIFGTPLLTNCVSATNLDYKIFDVKFIGGAGALTGDPGAGEAPTELHLPLSVRAENATGFTSMIELGELSLAQDMSFDHRNEETPASLLRLWPDGLPMRLGPFGESFTPQQFSFTTDDTFGPTPYAFQPPGWHAGNKGFEQTCDPSKPDPGDACTGSDTVSNAGYLDGPWEPVGDVSITIDGMSLSLDLPAGPSLIYETIFPRGTWVELEPPGSLSVVQGQVSDGNFDSGVAWLRREQIDLCALAPAERRFTLRSGALGPRIGIDGSLLAGVPDLHDDPLTPPMPVDWGAHTATDLGCGTLFVPPLAPDDDPQKTWNESQAPTILDRGIYAGFNYNRNQVCFDSLNQPLDKTCTQDSDCDTLAGEYCADGGFSPLCDPIDPLNKPMWNTFIDGVPRSFEIDPDQPGQGDREMAILLRGSGVTGVFDGGDDDFFIQNPGNPPDPPGFEYEFTRYGLAYREDRTEGADTIVSGDVKFPWPSLTEIPIPEMKVCSCGQPKGGKTPELLVKNTLLYWDADFFPYGVNLINSQASNQSCSDLFGSGCDDNSTDPNDTAIVQAITPIPRIQPDPESCFSLDTLGKPAEFTPISGAQLEFNESALPALPPYRFDVDFFELSPHGGETHQQVVVNLSQPYGYYDVSGELEVPYFGMTPSGLKIHPQDRNMADGLGPTHFPVDLHEKGNLGDSALTVSRVIAGNSVPVTYELDYFSPEVTADSTDGTEEVTVNGNVLGRGKLFAFADESAQSIGATKVAGAMIMTPEGGVHHGQADLGPAAAMRLWGATEPISRLAKLPTIMSGSLLQPAQDGQYNAVVNQLGHAPENLPAPDVLKQQLLDTGAIDHLSGHVNEEITFEVGDPSLSPPVIGRRTVGYMDFDATEEQVEFFEVITDQSTNGDFYAFDASLLQVDRHVKDTGMPITTLGRADVNGARQKMDLPGEQSIPFPKGSGARGGGSFFPGIEWDYDYDVDTSGPVPQFTFNSLTGTMDLTKGGLSGLGFDKMSATLAFYADGDWYFAAGLKVTWSGYGALGDILLGNTQDMTPLRKIDPMVAGFLKGVDQFDGAYVRVGIRVSLVDFGCLLNIGAGAEVAGWYISDSFGGKLRGYIFGDGACLVSVHGDMTLLGGVVNDVFKIQGNFWVAGGIGFCDEEDWDTPAAVLDDNFCTACVIRLKARGNYPPSDLDLRFSGPKISCAL